MSLMETAAGAATGGLTGGIIGAGSSLLSGAINSMFNKQSIEQQVQAQEELTDYDTKKQLAAQKELWDETNYPAQVKMMEQAGLNPALLYGKGGGGGATTGGSLPTQSVSSNINADALS